MKLEAKIENPITLKLSSNENVLILGKEKTPLTSGAVFGGDHFGFNLIVEQDGEEITTVYPTQCRIYGTQMANDELFIFEDHKYLPWKFSADGTLLSNAVFTNLKRDEMAYIAETFGVQTEAELEELNDYRKPSRR